MSSLQVDGGCEEWRRCGRLDAVPLGGTTGAEQGTFGRGGRADTCVGSRVSVSCPPDPEQNG